MKFDPATMYAATATEDGRRSATLTIANCILSSEPVSMADGTIIDNLSASEFKNALEYVSKQNIDVLNLRVNCKGGQLNEGLAMYDDIKALPCETRGIGFGIVASAATLLLCACDVRTLGANSTYMVHQPTAACSGTPEEMASYVEHVKAQRDRAFGIYAEVTGKPVEEIMADHQVARWYIGKAAVDYGFVQAVSDEQPDGEEDDEEKKQAEATMLADATATLAGERRQPKGWRALAAKMGMPYFERTQEAKEVDVLREQVAAMTIEAAGARETIASLRTELANVSANNAAAIDAEVTRRVAGMGIEPLEVPPAKNDLPPVEVPTMTQDEFNRYPLADRVHLIARGVVIK